MAVQELALNLGLLSTNSREKHTGEPVQFGTTIVLQIFLTIACASLIAARASEVRSGGAMLQPLAPENMAGTASKPLRRNAARPATDNLCPAGQDAKL